MVTLLGDDSYDPDGEPLNYYWTQVSGNPVVLYYPSESGFSIAFTAPLVGPSGETIAFTLTVDDGTDSVTSLPCQIIVENLNHPPTAKAGDDQTVNEGSIVALGGTGSDPDGDSLTFLWTQVSGPPVALSNPSSPTPTFTSPWVNPGGAEVKFQVTVYDGTVWSESDEVSIFVRSINDPPNCALARPNLDVLWPPNHKLIEVQIVNVTDLNDNQVTVTVTGVTQDGPVNGLGDGDTSPDAVIQGGKVLLRAERAGGGNGRVYRISFSAVDSFGEACTGYVTACVPHDKKKATCVDDGQIFNSLNP